MAPLDAERWAEVEHLFAAAIDLPAGERLAWLERECPDEDVRQEVGSLLEHAGLPLGSVDAAIAAESSAVEREQVSGRYRLLERIGEGGMGQVWLAEQKEPVRRRVALKLVKAGWNTREVMARFESERQALALMDHPAIAKVFDAGSTAQGAPYFVMEYVAGVPITSYCDNHKLTTGERLELFVHVCEGVQHAHQKAIIHRDLKPSNILVTEVDGRPVPKIIDFGVAKALAQKLTAETMLTSSGALVGTPEYMSPEQARASFEDIDTRTDVYSLGIVLYELLAGAPPLELRKIPFEELLRRLREEEPPKPSTKIRTHDPATSTAVAHKRRTEPVALVKQIRGDLDWIALKALEKDRSRRYGSPSDLAADIDRYLNNEPVLAAPPSAAYRARKFARRHRAALATACAFAVVLIGAAAISIRQTLRANREAAVAQAINDFLRNDVLAQASANRQSGPSTKPDPDLKVRTALDRASARITGKFGKQPEVEAAIRDTIGQTYFDLGLYPEAQKQWQRALELHRRGLGTKNPRTLKTMSRLGRAVYQQGRYAEAEALSLQTLEMQRRILGPAHPDTLYSTNSLASLYYTQGKYLQAEALGRQAVEMQRRVLGPEHPDTLASMNNLANAYDAQYKHAQAEALYSQVFEIRRRVLGPEHPDTLSAMSNLADAYDDTGKFAEAEALNSQTLEIRRRVLGPEHPQTLYSMNNLATVYYSRAEYPQAEVLYRQTFEIRRRVLGPEHPDTLVAMNNLAVVYSAQGKRAQAGALFSETLEISRRVLGPEHALTLAFLQCLAFEYQQQGKYGLAQTYAGQALAGRRNTLGSDQPDTMYSAADLALAYLSQQRFAQSEPLAREAAEFYRSKMPDDWQRFRAESLWGASLAGQKKYPEAEPLLLEGYQGMLARKGRMDVPLWYHLNRAHEWLVQLYEAWSKPDKAVAWRKK